MLDSLQGSDMTLPSGAVGVFNIDSSALNPTPHPPVCDMETWMVMELMDRGTLAAVVRGGGLVHPVTRNIKMVSVRGVDWGGGGGVCAPQEVEKGCGAGGSCSPKDGDLFSD